MSHRRFLLIALIAVVLAAASDTATRRTSAAEPSRPNIVIILTDDQGRADYSSGGSPDLRTPNMDRIFREGLTFENFFANSCVCSPTRAALLTGCFPHRVGVPGVIRDEPQNSWGWLSPQAKLLPQLLKPVGYHSAIIGKWHLGLTSPNTPTERGFDFFHGFLGDMMDDYETHLRHGHNFMRRNLEVITPQGHATDLFSDWACDYLAERARAPEPFLLYLAYNAPHDPIQPPREWLEKVQQREPGLSEKRAKLVALIEHLDSGIGKVLDTLDRTGLAKNTLVLFTSDNGGLLATGANNGPWRSGKTHMYEGGLRVPGAARWPGQIPPGSRTERTTLTMDLFATACAAAGVPPVADIDGVSCLPTLRGESESEKVRDFYFVWREGGVQHGGKTVEAFRRGPWKLLQDNPFAPLELFNLQSDPAETNDLAAKERTVFNELSAAMRKEIQRGGSIPWQPPNSSLVVPTVRELRDVIYGRKSDMALTMDIFIPAKQNGAAIIHLANGGWHKAHENSANFGELLKRGYTVFRVVIAGEPKFTVIEQMPDVARAVRFIRFHAHDYHIDPQRLGIEGASSGGHMSLLHAMSDDNGNAQAPDAIDRMSSRVQAAAVFFPLTDLLNYGATGAVQGGDLGPLTHHRASFDFTEFDPKTRAYVKVTDETRRHQLLRQASPITHVTKNSPPTLLIHGDKDEVVPLQQSEVLLAKLKEVGVPVKLVVHKDGGHPWPDFWRVDAPQLADWFDEYLKPTQPGKP